MRFVEDKPMKDSIEDGLLLALFLNGLPILATIAAVDGFEFRSQCVVAHKEYINASGVQVR